MSSEDMHKNYVPGACKMGSKMGGAPTPKWDPKAVLTTMAISSHLSLRLRPFRRLQLLQLCAQLRGLVLHRRRSRGGKGRGLRGLLLGEIDGFPW